MKTIFQIVKATTITITALLLSGCVTTYEDRARQQVHRQSETDRMDEKTRQINGRVEGVEMQLEDVQRELRELRRESADSGQATSLATSSRLDALEAKLVALEANRERDRKEIIDRLTEKITALMNSGSSGSSTSSQRVARPRPASTSEYGYEHQVKSGETLSQIASAYGVSMQAIIDANAIQNPNSLKVGTKLFVPE